MHIIKVEKKTKLAEKIGYFTITTIDLVPTTAGSCDRTGHVYIYYI